jgi:transposase-like protein
MTTTIDLPQLVPNLITRVRADGMKIFNPLARDQLIAQARSGQHSVQALAQVNGIGAFLIERWLSGGKKKVIKKPSKKAALPKLIPIRIQTPKPAALAPLACEVVLQRGSIKLQVDAGSLAQLITALSH